MDLISPHNFPGPSIVDLILEEMSEQITTVDHNGYVLIHAGGLCMDRSGEISQDFPYGRKTQIQLSRYSPGIATNNDSLCAS